MKPLSNKVFMISGAASGIGRATSLLLADKGASLSLLDLNSKGLQEIVKLIESQGGQATSIECDVSLEKDVESAVNKTLETLGRLDGAFNNAGVEGPSAPIHELETQEFDRVIAVNLRSVFLCLKYQLPILQRQGSGAIVNTASIFAEVAGPLAPAYAASKHGVLGLTRASALSAARNNVRVNAVCPGFADTPMVERIVGDHPTMRSRMEARHPLGRLVSPREIAQAVYWLLSDESSFVTGSAIPIDGGYMTQ